MSGIVDHWKCLNCAYTIEKSVLAPHSCPSCGEVDVLEPCSDTQADNPSNEAN